MGPYRTLLGTRGLTRLMGCQLFARLPQGMVSIALTIHLSEQFNSFSVAGTAVACLSFGQAVGAPMSSRFAAVAGARSTLVVTATVQATALVTLAATGLNALGALLACTIAGLATPPVAPVVRATYPDLVEAAAVSTLYALDTTAQEFIWVVGPILATGVAAAGAPSAGLLVAAGSSLIGVISLLTLSLIRATAPAPVATRPGAVVRVPTVSLAMAVSLLSIGSFLALEVAAIATFEGQRQLAGVAIALASLGSMVGGAAFASKRLGWRGLTVALAVQLVGTALCALPVATPWALGAFFLSGVGFAPAMATLHFAVSQRVSPGSAAEAFGWLMTAGTIGAAMGTLLAGRLVDSFGANGGYAAAAILAAAAVPLPGFSRRVLATRTPVIETAT
jgi:MFS family permease